MSIFVYDSRFFDFDQRFQRLNDINDQLGSGLINEHAMAHDMTRKTRKRLISGAIAPVESSVEGFDEVVQSHCICVFGIAWICTNAAS